MERMAGAHRVAQQAGWSRRSGVGSVGGQDLFIPCVLLHQHSSTSHRACKVDRVHTVYYYSI
jgi:hypothetical protein